MAVVGDLVGLAEGVALGVFVGDLLGIAEGVILGVFVGVSVWVAVGVEQVVTAHQFNPPLVDSGVA